MKRIYTKFMHDWETRMTTRDSNRVVRPFEWGLDWLPGLPGVNGNTPTKDSRFDEQEKYFLDLNRKIIANSDEFYGYEKPTDFQLSSRMFVGERRPMPVLTFTSAVASPHPTNNTV